MFQAKNGRQLNLAAKTIVGFFASKGVPVKHADALSLVSRLTGFPNYEAAKAALEGTPRGVASEVKTWRDLGHAIGTLTEEQLDMDVNVTEGCDGDGNATFARSQEFLLASAPAIDAGAGLFKPNQPLLLIEEFDPALNEEDADRVCMQFEVATGESGQLARREIRARGLHEAIEELNADYSLHINLGDFIIYSESNEGYWNADFGWVSDKFSATGYGEMAPEPSIGAAPDAKFVSYLTAVDNLDK